MTRTFRLDKLYHRFLKPKGVSLEKLPLFATQLYEAQFIELYQDTDHESERYSETAKLTSKQHRDELFKIIQGLK